MSLSEKCRGAVRFAQTNNSVAILGTDATLINGWNLTVLLFSKHDINEEKQFIEQDTLFSDMYIAWYSV